eukprot:CAMPEP_0177795464 /NCGR_PEP_ID=MMETSP0491_2-20121128/26246_1 /TAXON_ID=63592 /ORGANISM="Tetraselmis chuii, Strain PLY429" /LENGTH=454 /DNA_ID=CAMNT_0019318295 /DNA_START=70 /DNA_END=1433 /DNA_ORIENTATION=+
MSSGGQKKSRSRPSSRQTDENGGENAAPRETANGNGVDGHSKKPISVGRMLEIDCTADVAMETIVEKLKLLDYEREFCKTKRPPWSPLTRSYFAVPSPKNNQNEQFFYFTSLVAWLLNQANRKFPAPQQFDDPNTTCSSILQELKATGFATPSYPPAKLKQGYGEAVCGVLDNLIDYVMEKRAFVFRKPIYQADGYPEEAVEDLDEAAMGDGMEVADPQNMPDEMYDDDDEEAYLDIRGGGATATVDSKAKEATEQDESVAVIEARVDPAEWKLELERVGPKLKITLAADTKDWRSHLEQAHSHKKEIEQLLPESKVHLDKVNAEVTAELEKVGTRERFLNNQFDALIMEYRLVRERLGEVQERYGKSSEAISELTNELGRVTEELEEVKRVLEERGSNISDTSPVVKIKEAINLLQSELLTMEVRIGVVEHSLLQVSLKDRGRLPGVRASRVR